MPILLLLVLESFTAHWTESIHAVFRTSGCGAGVGVTFLVEFFKTFHNLPRGGFGSKFSRFY